MTTSSALPAAPSTAPTAAPRGAAARSRCPGSSEASETEGLWGEKQQKCGVMGISWGYTYMLIYVLYMYYILYYIYIYCIHMCIYIYILYTHMCDWAMDLGVPYIAKSHGFKMGIQPTRLERWWITWLIHVHHASKRKSERTECVWKFICCYIPQLAIVFGRESHDQVDAPRALLGWQHPSSPWTSHEHQTSGCELVP